MKQTKSLIRRLAFVPCLLAFGLVLAAGEAAAQAVTLSVSPKAVREDADATNITVTAKVGSDAAADIVVALSLSASQTGLNERFRITLPPLVIPKGKKEISGTIVLSPINDNKRGTDLRDNGSMDDLVITIAGEAGANDGDPTATITLIDDDKLSTKATFSFAPGSLSKDEEVTDVVVTATLDGSIAGEDLSIPLRYNSSPPVDRNNNIQDSDPAIASDTLLVRDADYTVSTATISIRKKEPSGKATIRIEPKGQAGFIAIEGRKALKEGRNTATSGAGAGLDTLWFEGVDLNGDGDTGDIFNLEGPGFYSGYLWESELEVDINGDNDIKDDYQITEALIGIDLNNDGDKTDGALFYVANNKVEIPPGASLDPYGTAPGKIEESKLRFPVIIQRGFFEIKPDALAAIKDDGLTATPSVLRESLVGQTEGSWEESVALKVELENALTEDEKVRFFVRDEEGNLSDDFKDGAELATRGTHYEATVDELIIPAGEKIGTTTLNLTLFDDGGRNPARYFRVEARVGSVSKYVGIKITDDETPTTHIALAASPSEIKAGSGEQTIAITGTANGDVFEEDQKITLVVVTGDDYDKPATRDTEYTAVFRSLTIPAGQIEGSTTVSITPLAGGDKKVWIGSVKNNPFTKNIEDDDVNVSAVAVVLKDADPTDEAVDPGALRFDVDLSSTVYEGMVGSALKVLELPEATGGEGDRTYTISANLPAGLSFDPDTRTISGTPTTVGTEVVTYAVIDDQGSAATLLTIEIAAAAPPTVEVAEVSVSQTSVRENAATTEIAVKATLSSPAPAAETIRFTIEAPSVGAAAVRDVDYTASIGGRIAVAAGATQASTTLMLTPIDNGREDGNRVLAVVASGSGGSASTDVTIADDETASTSISLSAEPHTVSESAGVTSVMITATLNGKVLDADALVTLSVAEDSEATRDVDYSALFNPLLTIPAGEVSGSTELLIDPTADGADEGNETITLLGAIAGLLDGSGTITLEDYDAPAESEAVAPLAFAADAGDFAGTAGEALTAVALPAADGGSGDVAYSVSELPAGLSFDAATRTVSGTPEAAGVTEVTYTATDSAGATAELSFSITINEPLVFPQDLSDLFGLFNAAAGKRVPMQAGLNTDARLYLAAPTELPNVGEDFVLDVRLADVAALKGYGLQVAYEADKLAFVEVLTEPSQEGIAAPQTRVDQAGVLLVAALGEVVSDSEVMLSLVFRPTTEIEHTVVEITDTQTYDSALGFNRLALPAPVALQTRPEVFALANNYPNPFNPATTIQYALPQASDVALTVYNVLGQPVRTLVAEHQSAGRYVVEWDATNDSGQSLSSGMYFYRLQADGAFLEVKKMLLLR